MKIKLIGSAKIKDKTIVLTDGLHQKGRVILGDKINGKSLLKPWKLSAIVSLGNNKGISDFDGPGGDGIWFEFNERTFSVGLDTFFNEYNDSGNEVDLFVEGQVVEKKSCTTRLNDGKKLKVDIICEPLPQTFVKVFINNKMVLSYAFKTLSLEELLSGEVELGISSFTGDAGSTQIVHKLRLGLIGN